MIIIARHLRIPSTASILNTTTGSLAHEQTLLRLHLHLSVICECWSDLLLNLFPEDFLLKIWIDIDEPLGLNVVRAE